MSISPADAATLRQQQWQLDFLHAAQADRYSTGRGVIVGVIDSGVNAKHPDLAGQVLQGADFPQSGTHGLQDVKAHGTQMASVIAAKGVGGQSARGLAPGAKILPVRIGVSQIDDTRADEGIRWAVDHGARVINLSFGDDVVLRPLAAAVKYAQDRDVVVVAAAGNTYQHDRAVISPASLPGVVAVAVVDRKGVFAPKISVSGSQVVLAAPGIDIIGAGLGKGYVKGSGTSPSAALVSATAALVRSRYPTMDAANVINRLIATADDRGPKGRDPQYGFGIVDPVRALTAKVPAVATNPLLPAGTPSSAPSPTGAASSASSPAPAATEVAGASEGDVAAANAAAAAAAAQVAAAQPADAAGASSGKSSSSGLLLAGGGVFLVLAAFAAWLAFRRRARS